LPITISIGQLCHQIIKEKEDEFIWKL
jgi:hypothetical protein